MNNVTKQPVLISIVTANSYKVFQSLDVLIASMAPETPLQIHLFDNNSSETFKLKLKEYLRYPFIRITFNKENKGFGYGQNQLLLNAESSFEYGVIFNPDILVDEQTILRLVDELIRHPECAMIAPKTLNEDGTTQYLIRQRLDVFSYALRFLPFGFLKKIFKKRLENFECRFLPDDRPSYVRMVSGSFMVIDLQKFSQVKGFDQRYFMYFEDNDLCLKFEEASEKILYQPAYSVVHLYGKGAHKNIKLFRIFISSMTKFFNKWGWRLF